MRLQIKVIPSSSKDCISCWLDDTLKIKVKAPPEKGKANKAVIKLLEKTLSIPKGNVAIAAGANSTRKTVVIEGCDSTALRKKINDKINKSL